MTPPSNPELLALLQNEIDLGNTFLESYTLSFSAGHFDHAKQALQAADHACRTGMGFLHRLTEEELAYFEPKFRDLEQAIRTK